MASQADVPPLDGWGLAQDGAHPVPTFTPFFPQPAALVQEPLAPAVLPVASPVQEVLQEVVQEVVQDAMADALGVSTTTTTTTATNLQYVGDIAVITPAVPTGIPMNGWANEAPNLKSMCAQIERELAIEAGRPVVAVVREACAQLGVPEEGTLIERARKCYEALGSPSAPVAA